MNAPGFMHSSATQGFGYLGSDPKAQFVEQGNSTKADGSESFEELG